MSSLLLAYLLLQAAAAPAPAAVLPAPAAPATLQQRFDAATAAADEGRCADAVAGFDALESAPVVQRNPQVRATLGLRRARCLIGGERDAQAVAAIRAALPVLAPRGAEFAEELTEGRRLLAVSAKNRGDYDGAIRENEAALATLTGAARLPALMALADLTMFDHDGQALKYAQEARTLAAAPETSARMLAGVQAIYARVLLNEGRKAEAYQVLKDSLRKQGGLSLKVNLSSLATRSDVAVAALLNGDKEKAREYLAYTGAGRLKRSFIPGSEMVPPTCGEDGLKPDDFAIIELAVATDGHVAGVSPIYVGGDRSTALAFARAVRGWSWTADEVAAIPPLFRLTTRLEVRCTRGVGQRLSLTRMLLDAAPDWAADENGTGTPWEGRSAAAALPLQRAAVAAFRGDRRARLRALIALWSNPVFPRRSSVKLPADGRPTPEAKAMVLEMRSLARELQAPAPLRLWTMEQYADDDAGYADHYRALLADPTFAADPLSAAELRVALASPAEKYTPPKDAAALLDAAIAQDGLSAHHPMKVRAMLLKANLLGATGDTAGAAAVLARTGLTAEQCSIAGVQPAAKRTGGNWTDFPDEAAMMGFSGWVRTEFDISPDGRVLTPRALVAYPPFIFNDAANTVIRGSRFTSSFQPDAAVACAANNRQIVFIQPD